MPEPVDSAKIELLRDFIIEQLSLAIHRGEVALQFLEIGDDAGMRYAVKGLVGHVRLVASAANDIETIRQSKNPELVEGSGLRVPQHDPTPIGPNIIGMTT